MKERFEEVIRTRERLRELFEPPGHMVNNKVIDRIDDICRRFIAASPFVMVATRVWGRSGRHAEKKTSVRNPWTKEDLQQLKALSKTRTPVVEVAKAMKRTEGAVRQKAKTIGVGLGHRR